MRVDERFPGDYQVISMLRSLVTLLDLKDEKGFGAALWVVWESMNEHVPESAKRKPSWLVLDSYFKTRGDLRKAMRVHEDHMRSIVGHDDHQAAMDRMRDRANAVVAQFRKVLGV